MNKCCAFPRESYSVLSLWWFIANWEGVKQERWSTTGQPLKPPNLHSSQLFQTPIRLTVPMQPFAKPPTFPCSDIHDGFYVILLVLGVCSSVVICHMKEFCKEAFRNWTFDFSGESSCGFTSKLMKAFPTMKWWFSIPVLYWASPIEVDDENCSEDLVEKLNQMPMWHPASQMTLLFNNSGRYFNRDQ